MVGQSLAFLADIELLNVVDKLLLKSVLIVVDGWNLLQSLDDSVLYFKNSALFERLNALE